MTNYEAIETLKANYPDACYEQLREAVDKAIKVLNATGDTISRQAAIDELEERIRANGYSNTALVSELNRSIGYIMRLPAIDPVKHGKWELVDKAEPMRYGCSECKRLSYTQDNYCSYCGARMDGVEKIGHWVDHIKDFWCSECGCRILPEQVDSFSKCPNCGALMEDELWPTKAQ